MLIDYSDTHCCRIRRWRFNAMLMEFFRLEMILLPLASVFIEKYLSDVNETKFLGRCFFLIVLIWCLVLVLISLILLLRKYISMRLFFCSMCKDITLCHPILCLISFEICAGRWYHCEMEIHLTFLIYIDFYNNLVKLVDWRRTDVRKWMMAMT